MKLSKMHLRTLREVPTEAEVPSHILLLRAGMIRKLASGIYGFMPMGWRSVKKIEEIIRQEMDRAGAQEILMSAVQPAELWEESGRWSAYGPELWRIKDRNGRDFCLGPTHEEIFTDIIRNDVSSYRQLPQNLYQIQHKYRDEARPRFGLMRSREFIMKDAYSFDKDQEGLDKSYEDMYNAYDRIFTRCGLTFRPVEADTGAIGGAGSHEFTALSEIGESEIAYCENCDMAATVERAACVDAAPDADDVEMLPMEEVHTPGTKTIEEVAGFLNIDKSKTIKALLFERYDDDGNVCGYVAAFVRGDRELNMIKLVNALDIPEHAIAFADEEKIFVVLDCSGFVFCNVIVGFSQVVHGESSFLTGKGFEAGHLLVRLHCVTELTVHEVVFRNTEPSLRNETVIREVFDEAHTELVGLFVFATSFLHGSSLVNHGRSLVFLRILVDVFEEVAQRLLVISLRKLVDVGALCRLVIAVSAPCHIFFILGVLVEEVLFFELELVMAQLLESGCATLVLLALTVVYLLFPLSNGIFHALFIEATGTASLFSLVLQHLVRVGALGLFRALRHGLTLGRQFLGFIDFVFTRI